MSFYDFEISKSIWNGKVPVKITVETSELDGYSKTLEPIFLEASRCSYLPLVTKQIQKVLIELGIPEDSLYSVWYEYNDQPLKWHYPIGLLHDLYSNKNNLPWSLKLHFRDLPTETILLKPTPENMQDIFMSAIKEADFLRNGTTKKVMNLSKRDSTQLWQSLASDQYEDFRTVNKQLIEYSNQLRFIPLKIYLPDNCPVIQELVPFNHEIDNEYTIKDVLYRMLPELFSESVEIDKNILVVTHGVEIPLDTPVHWAYENLSFADNFLHIVIAHRYN